MSNQPTVKRWTAKRKAAAVMDIFKGKNTVAEVARQHDLTVSEVEGWIEEAQCSIESRFLARPKGIREQYKSELWETTEALSEAHLQMNALKIYGPPR
jgi:transposase-like protein